MQFSIKSNNITFLLDMHSGVSPDIGQEQISYNNSTKLDKCKSTLSFKKYIKLLGYNTSRRIHIKLSKKFIQ